MKRFGPMLFSTLFVLGSLFAVNVNTASAIKPFADEFMDKYVKKEPGTAEEKALAEAVGKAKCNLCHDSKSKSKKDHNAYGKELAKLLDKTKDKADKKKITESLEVVAKLHTKEGDSSSPTYGDLIQQGKLPAE